mgnify:CR=1 FL=1
MALIVRGQDLIVPTGDTHLAAGDLLVLAARSFEEREHLNLREIVVEGAKYDANQPLSAIASAYDNRVILIKRGIDTLIPTGSTVIKTGDILVVAQTSSDSSFHS